MPKNKKHDEKMITMTGDCFIKAAAVFEGEETKLPSVKMEVYNGGKINVGYWGAVVVDLKGMTANDATPILYAHDSYSIDGVLGQTDSVVIGDSITATGSIMGSSETTEKVKGLAKNGYKFQVSMGAQPNKTRDIPEAESVEVNGQTMQGPFTLIVESKLSEISILPLGADDTTSADIAASHNSKEGTKMSDKKTPAVKSPEEVRAEAVKDSQIEVDRIQAVKAVSKDNPEIMAQAVKEGWNESKTEIAVLKASNAEKDAKIEAHGVQDKRPEAPNIVDRNVIAKAMTVNAISAAACRNLGLPVIKGQFKDDDLNKSEDVHARSITEIVRASLAIDGKSLDASHRDPASMLRAAFSTATVSNVVSNIGNKHIGAGFGSIEQSWRKITEIMSLNDFKSNTVVDYVVGGLLDEMAPDGEIKHASISDTSRTIQLKTYAKMLAITRQDFINDDLGLFASRGKKFGFMAARTFNTKFWAALQAAIAANFTADNGNLITTVLGLTGLGNAEAAFGALTDVDGNPLGTDATMLLTSKAGGATARTLHNSTLVQGSTAKNPNGNPFANRYESVDTSYRTGATWFLVGNPIGIPLMSAGFLNGMQAPMIESSDADFNNLGIQTRCVYDFAVAFANKDAAVYSSADA